MIVAIDCDGTIFKWEKFPAIGEPVPYAKEIINRLHASGHEIIIWTCRGRNGIHTVHEALEKYGIRYHGINKQGFTTNFDPSPKLIADVYVDDKSPYCPLIPNTKGKPYVDWLALEIWFKREGFYTIPLGE